MPAVRTELAAGLKSTHWMWFVFPQLAGLGHSAMARRYGLADRAEAEAYLAHPLLGPRLRECVGLVLASGRPAHAIFGDPDTTKLRSCLTLFAAIEPDPFALALTRLYEGPDAATLRMISE